jgi:hypothetical protein
LSKAADKAVKLYTLATAADVGDRQERGARRKAGGQGGAMRGIFTYFPLLAIPVVIYNIMAWGGAAFFGGAKSVVESLSNQNFLIIPMVSSVKAVDSAGAAITQHMHWAMTPGDLLLGFALVMLFVEVLKATDTGRASIANHGLSLIVFIVCIIEFLLFAPFATSVFFLITLMTLLDVLAGVIVTIVTARRDIAVGDGFDHA